jgi:hypothetical protein
MASVAELMRQARRAGRLRADFTVEDLVLVIMAGQGIRTASPAAAVAASRRFAALAVRASEVPLPDATPDSMSGPAQRSSLP